jgi:hypothetical protein
MRPIDDDGFPIDDDPPAGPDKPVVLALAVTSPPSGTTLTGASNGVTLVVTGTARVRSGLGAIDRVEVQVGNGPVRQAVALTPHFATWTATETIAMGGTYNVTVRAHHPGDVVKEVTFPVTAVITPDPPVPDTTPPTVAISSPAPGASLVADGSGALTIEIAGTAADIGQPASGIAQVEVTVNGQAVAVTPLLPDWSRWSASGTLVGMGQHGVTARVVDHAGLAMEATADLFVVDRPIEPPVVERLLLVEKCQLSSYLGAYGAGRTIKTISLLPGEKTKVSVKTYKRTSTTATEASSILDSYTHESQDDFEKTLQQEQTNKQASDESFKWHADAQASGGWGCFSASVSAGAGGGSNASREELAKNVANAVNKHAAKASSKRDVEINDSREDKAETGDEFSSESTVENINLSRTLNFVFRQMNQEFVTVLHLVDVRVAHVRGDLVPDADGTQHIRYTYREVTLSQLDGLLERVIAEPFRPEVRKSVLEVLSTIFDHEDVQHSMVEERVLKSADGTPMPNASYLRVPRGKVSEYVDPATGTKLTVPGVILATTKNVVRTDGVLCDALLGQGAALDHYSQGLQDAVVESKSLDNAAALAEVEQKKLAAQLVAAGDATKVALYRDAYVPPPQPVIVGAPTTGGSNGNVPVH